MKFLIDLFNRSKKGDAFRPPASPEKYADGVAKLNANLGNQSNQITTGKIGLASKSAVKSGTTGKIPGL